MESADYEKRVEQMNQLRETVICEFEGISFDMNYILCIPSVHATCQSEEMIVDFNGEIREISGNFPEDKAKLVVKWVILRS